MDKLTFNNLNEASRILKEGGILAFPTETVFGLGIIFDNEEAYNRLNKVKERRPNQPYTLMCAHVSDIANYAEINELALKIIENFIPGELTIVLKAKVNEPKYLISDDGYIGFRISSDTDVQHLIDFVGKPLLVPSANRSGKTPLMNSSAVIDEFGNEIDGVLLGEALGARPSTIVKVIDDSFIILREGKITKSQIEEVLNKEENK